MLTKSLLILSALILTLQAERKPNLIYILVDDMAWADTGFNGHEFYETPHIDKLCADGVKLDQFYTGGANCAPTRACIISGMYTPRHKIYQPGGRSKGDHRKMRFAVPNRSNNSAGNSIKPEFEVRTELDESCQSIAETLKTAGYITARYGKWHLGDDTQGFDISSSNGQPGVDQKHYGNISVADEITDASIEFIKTNKDKPFFLYLSHWDVHMPIRAKKELVDKFEQKNKKLGTSYNAGLAGMTTQVDQSVKRIRAIIEELDLAEDTLILFSSDNGGPGNVTDNAPLKGVKGSFYEGGVRVPACAYWKGRIPSGSKSDIVMTSVDILPTFAELAGAKLPSSQPVDGVSIYNALVGKDVSHLQERAVFWHYPLYLQGSPKSTGLIPAYGTQEGYFRATPSSLVRKGDWKLIYFIETKSAELYNVRKDPYEQTELSQAEPKKYQEMLQLVKEWQEATQAPLPTKLNPQFDPSYDSKKKADKGKK